jgi:sulfotransferase
MQQIHFISGMPRSGSSMLSAILRQNPALHASITSPVALLYERLHQNMGAKSDYAEMLTEVKRENLLRGLFTNYYSDIDRPIVMDTNRHWCTRMAALAHLFPSSRVIACVRDPAWVLDSFERIHQRNPLLMSKMFTPEQSLTTHTRVEAMAAVGGLVGFAYDATAEAYYGAYRGNLIVIDYDEFCAAPAAAIAAIYAALALPPFKHQFEDIGAPCELGYDATQFDRRFGVPGLHSVKPKVERRERPTILPPELFKRFANKSFWRESK